MKNQEVWLQCLNKLKETISANDFRNCFAKSTIFYLDTYSIIIKIKAEKELISYYSNKYSGLIANFLKEITKNQLQVKFESFLINSGTNKKFIDGLKLDYSFDNFITGGNNEFPYAAAYSLASSGLRSKTNPLFIYCKQSLGKTHLLHAIGNHLKHNHNLKVLYSNSNDFFHEYINNINTKTGYKFDQKYSDVDVLILDDIHYLENKKATQDTLFHLFNDLLTKGKLLIFSADVNPKDLHNMENRLITRFLSGLVLEIEAPDLETRIAILIEKVQKSGLDITYDILEYIASNITSNIADLEGALIKLLLKSSVDNIDMNLDIAKNTLNFNNINDSDTIYVEKIIDVVIKFYNINENKIIGSSREKKYVLPRQIAMYLCKLYSGKSLKKIGSYFNKNHATVIHACKIIETKMQESEKLLKEVSKLKESIICDYK